MGYFVNYMGLAILLINFNEVLSIVTSFDQPRHFRRHISNVPNWEYGLRDAVYRTLVREKQLHPNLRQHLYTAPFVGRQDSATPFGDIIILARGQLYSAPGGFQFVQDPYQNDCDGCHNTPVNCDHFHCENWKPHHHERLLALWTVKRIRHRDNYGHQYELVYKVSPITTTTTWNGKFDYNIPGHIYSINVDSRQYLPAFIADDLNTWYPSFPPHFDNHYLPPTPSHDDDFRPNVFYTEPKIQNTTPKIIDYYTTQQNSRERERHLYKDLLDTLSQRTSTSTPPRLTPSPTLSTIPSNVAQVVTITSAKTSTHTLPSPELTTIPTNKDVAQVLTTSATKATIHFPTEAPPFTPNIMSSESAPTQITTKTPFRMVNQVKTPYTLDDFDIFGPDVQTTATTNKKMVWANTPLPRNTFPQHTTTVTIPTEKSDVPRVGPATTSTASTAEINIPTELMPTKESPKTTIVLQKPTQMALPQTSVTKSTTETEPETTSILPKTSIYSPKMETSAPILTKTLQSTSFQVMQTTPLQPELKTSPILQTETTMPHKLYTSLSEIKTTETPFETTSSVQNHITTSLPELGISTTSLTKETTKTTTPKLIIILPEPQTAPTMTTELTTTTKSRPTKKNILPKLVINRTRPTLPKSLSAHPKTTTTTTAITTTRKSATVKPTTSNFPSNVKNKTNPKSYKDNFDDIFGAPQVSTMPTIFPKHRPADSKEADDIFGYQPSPVTTTIKVTEETPKIIYSGFYSLPTVMSSDTTELPTSQNYITTVTVDETTNMSISTTEPPTRQSYITSVSFEVNKRNKTTTRNETDEPLDAPKMIQDKSYMNNNSTKETDTKTKDILTLSVINHAKSIDYLNSNYNINNCSSVMMLDKPKYRRRTSYKPRKTP